MINRYELVNRHNPVLNNFQIDSPLTVGNGEFAFTADITGLQSFPELYQEEVPLCTMAQWGWHTFEVNDEGFQRDKLQLKWYQSNERKIPYASSKEGQEELFDFLRQNPHKFHLGQIGLYLKMPDGSKVEEQYIKNIEQKLDIWQGILYSKFKVDGIPVSIRTVCHPHRDMLAVSIDSPLINKGRLGIELKFPYAAVDKTAADWDNKDKHRTLLRQVNNNRFDIHRIMDNESYFCSFFTLDKGFIDNIAKHHYQYWPDTTEGKLEFTCEFTRKPLRNQNLNFEDVEKASREYWFQYWNNGGIIELSNSVDPRAAELERRIVLSQYLTAIQCAGSYPPQETGLTCNSWYGKFHLEMHFWHAVHFAFWGRTTLLEKSLWWYHSILDRAKELARTQGLKGARWPKMVGPAGFDSPSPIGPFLIWQQPHPIIYAELCYRARPDITTLEYYKEIVDNTASFMVSFADYDTKSDRYVLGPAIIPAQECHQPEQTINPTFELEYWYFALNIAQKWRERLGLKRNQEWQEVIDKLAKLPVNNKLYLAHENCLDTFRNHNYDHPSMLGAYGLLPGNKVDADIMLNTLKQCLQKWQFEEVWGWDFPLMAMTAARLGESELAIDLLLMESPKNTYLLNGHNRQGLKSSLPLYLPGNGALLLAVGMMAAGWEGDSGEQAPGFPAGNGWSVKYEGIDRYF